ncbi:RRP15-like protein [Trichoplusia ni]|uniref:RRP15-like protein n=1 Tax=Trichoplusia ni TaxID=7111 RepID=A0A7E5WR96_TRINI|nr:RRP15-like protein [Trichoplusia ni]
MVVATNMNKPVLKVSMDSDSESSSEEESETSENEIENGDNAPEELDEDIEDGVEADAESDASDEEGNPSDQGEGHTSDADDSNASDLDDSNASGEEESKSVLMTNEGWADSVAKILGSSKPKNKKTLVLSRAKKHADIVKTVKEEKPAFEIIDEKGEKKPVVKKEEPVETSEPPAKKVKHEKASIRMKPNILEKDRERLLSKIATKGVVQLFNAVRNQQKTLEKEMDRNDLSEGKKEKILKKFDKRTFLDTLMGQSKSIIVDEATKVAKNEVKDEDAPKWSALRDDFMMGAKMKDWDKESVDE